MTTIDSLTLGVPDPAAASAFYSAAFPLDDRLAFRASDEPTEGFRGFTVSLVVSRPATVDALAGAAIAAGATELKPVAKSLWGYGGVISAPDGSIWKIATSAKRDRGPATRDVDDIVLLLGVADVAASKRFYVGAGLEVAKSFGSKYVQFDTGAITLALYRRRALAKDAGVPEDGSGSHRIVIGGGTDYFADPDGFEWEPAAAEARLDSPAGDRAATNSAIRV